METSRDATFTYKTIEESMYVLKSLVEDPEGEFFPVQLKMTVPQDDAVDDVALTLELQRLGRAREKADYESTNLDFTYRTNARWPRHTTTFLVDVTIHTFQADYAGATLKLARTSLDEFKDSPTTQ